MNLPPIQMGEMGGGPADPFQVAEDDRVALLRSNLIADVVDQKGCVVVDRQPQGSQEDHVDIDQAYIGAIAARAEGTQQVELEMSSVEGSVGRNFAVELLADRRHGPPQRGDTAVDEGLVIGNDGIVDPLHRAGFGEADTAFKINVDRAFAATGKIGMLGVPWRNEKKRIEAGLIRHWPFLGGISSKSPCRSRPPVERAVGEGEGNFVIDAGLTRVARRCSGICRRYRIKIATTFNPAFLYRQRREAFVYQSFPAFPDV